MDGSAGPHRHLPDRRRHRPRAGAGAEPRLAGAAAPAGGSARPRRHHGQELAQPDHGRAPDLARTAATTRCTCATTPTLNVTDVLARLPGMGDVQRLRRAATTPCASGSIRRSSPRAISPPATSSPRSASRTCRSPPARSARRPRQDAEFQLALNAMGRLTDEEQFRDIIIKTGDDGEVVRLGDVARVELGAAGRTRCAACSTTRTRSPSRSSRRPAPTRSSCPTRCARRWTS